jgi:hypothetical protein
MKHFRTFCMALALTASVAQADTPKKDAPAAGPSTELVKKFLAFFDKLVDTVVADKDTCPKMATDVNSLIDANKDLLAQAQKAKSDGRELPAEAKQHVADNAKRMMGALQKCGNDQAVQSAFQRLEAPGGGGDKKPAK